MCKQLVDFAAVAQFGRRTNTGFRAWLYGFGLSAFILRKSPFWPRLLGRLIDRMALKAPGTAVRRTICGGKTA